MKIKADYYQQFDANYSLTVPAEGYGGWKTAEIEINPQRTALLVMHAWDTGTFKKYPGWHRSVEFFPRANAIMEKVFPPLLSAVRTSPLKLYHITSGSYYCTEYPGSKRTEQLAGSEPPRQLTVEKDSVLENLEAFRKKNCLIGDRNRPDVERGFQNMRFPRHAEPRDDEAIAWTTHQLDALCRADGINHLVYIGFAINECLMTSPCGMFDMRRRGYMCSTIRQAVTAVENKETARDELAKQNALWRVGVSYGFVFDVENFVQALSQ